jgi:cytoskeleton protein RodZ
MALMNASIGQQLRQARQARDLTLEQVAFETHIRAHYLEAIEAGDYDRLPSLVQVRGFLRIYAGFLGLDPEPLVAMALNGGNSPLPIEQPTEPSGAPALQPSLPPDQAEACFIEVGQKIRRQRELLGLSLEDVERHTHLRLHNLRALETGALDELPSPVQGRGMLNNYAVFLGLDPEPLLLRFAEGLQARLVTHRQELPTRPASVKKPRRLPAPLRGLFSGEVLLGGLLVLILAGFAVWGAIRIADLRSANQVEPTVPSIADQLLPTGQPTTTPSLPPSTELVATQVSGVPFPTVALAVETATLPVETSAEGTTPLPTIPNGAVQVNLVVHERAWVRVTVDGKVAFQGRMLPGSAYTFSGEQQVEVLTGNGAALQLFYNQRDLGPMGIYGEVVSQVFSPQGILTPTPTITPTPTATLPATETPAGTSTPPTPTAMP